MLLRRSSAWMPGVGYGRITLLLKNRYTEMTPQESSASPNRRKDISRRKADAHLEELLEAAASRAIDRLQPDHACRFGHISPEAHEKHHRMCDSAIELLDRLNNTKWGVFKAVAIFLVLGGLSLLAAGFTLKFGGHQ